MPNDSLKDTDVVSVKSGKGVWTLVAVLLCAHTVLLGFTATQMAPTALEGPLLAAGVSHWQLDRYELYRVNPPLVRMVAALPVVIAGCETDWSKYIEGARVRPEYLIGYQFIELNGERSIWLMTLARWAVIPFSLLGGFYCFLWGRDLYGCNRAGMIPLIIWCFDPLILGNGSLITNDVAATSLGIVAGYYFWRWLLVPGWWKSFWLGVVLAFAILAKTTWLVFYGLWLVMTLLWLITRKQPGEGIKKTWLFRCGQLFLALVVSVWVINMFYGFDDSFDQANSYTFVSRKFQKLNDSIPFFSSVSIPFPRQFIIGLDTQISDFEHMNHISYLRGQWRKEGWLYYYLYGLWVKEPHGTQLLFVFAVTMWLIPLYRPRTDELVLLLPACFVLFLVSSQTAFNHHFRYILPCIGLVSIFMGKTALLMNRGFYGKMLVILLLTVSILSSLVTSPHYLSYYNELAGGNRLGYRHMLHSATDWGQDLLYLKKWLNHHPEIQLSDLNYWGGFVPSAIGINVKQLSDATMSHNHRSNEKDNHIQHVLQPGWYAISVHLLYSPDSKYPCFRDLVPTFVAGHTINVYYISQKDAEKINGQMN